MSFTVYPALDIREGRVVRLLQGDYAQQTTYGDDPLPRAQAFADADVVLQTSIGFETQGMTVFEAAAFGTPALCCDKRVAGELRPGHWWVTSDESVEALAMSMKEAFADVASGNNRRGDGEDNSWLLQSKLTERMVEIYKEQIKLRSSAF